MDLPTHVFFGLAIGFLFFGHAEFALLVALGAIIPDLDREYWFIPLSVYRDEQLHRALLHNVFVMGVFYLISPFLALGIFLHMLLDSFTTSKDRGCEWFWPLSRLVKRGLYDYDNIPRPLDPNQHVYFYQEDLDAVIEYAEPNLEEPPEPWRRVYGPALNSSLLDRCFLLGSISLVGVWVLTQFLSNNGLLLENLSESTTVFVGYLSLVALVLGGELDRRDQEPPFGVKKLDPLRGINFLKWPLVLLGIILAVVWSVLYREHIFSNLELISNNWVQLVVSAGILVTISIVVTKYYIKKSGNKAIV